MLAAGEITPAELRRKNSLLHRMGLDPQSGVILNWQPGYEEMRMEMDKHIARCLVLLNGQGWPEVHGFLDQFFVQVPGLGHRIILHHKLGVEIVVRKFGEEARAAAELHIRDDMGMIQAGPQEAWNLVRNFLQPGQLGTVNEILASLGLPEAGPGLD